MTDLITDHMDIWTDAQIQKTNVSRGRGKNGNGQPIYGIKKLRELILELAVRGKLVPQDPNDEPASVLLERIAEEKKRLIKEGKIKKQKKLPEIWEDETPFELPERWEFIRFIELLDFQGGSQPPKSQFSDKRLSGYVQLIQIRDLGPNPQPVYVPAESVTKFCSTDDIMIGRYGASVGKVFWGKNGAYNVALIKLINEFNAFDKSFLFLLMESPLGQSLFLGISRSAQSGFSKKDVERRVLPYPPVHEQHRIVAKVDELMALCDQLEQQQTDNNATHQTLVEILLTTLTTATDPKDFDESWQRIANHFDTLFTTEQSIDHLKQTILQLAVMGRLVPQDPDDEPASVLLEKIAKEKARLVKDGKIKKQKKLAEIREDEKPFEVPLGWKWVRFNQLVDPEYLISYGVLVPGLNVENGVPFIRIADLDLTNPPQRPEKSIDEKIDKKYERTRIIGGEILMGVVGSIGKLGIAPDSWRGANIARAICRIVPSKFVNIRSTH